MKEVYLLRHAEAERISFDASDHSRSLTDSGIAEAEGLALWLKGRGISVDIALCSTACRTGQTYNILLEECDLLPPPTYVDALYLASAGDILAQIQNIDENNSSANSVIIIAHNPGIAEFARMVGKLDIADSGELSYKLMSYPPATLCRISYDDVTDWRDITAGAGKITLVK